MCRTVNLIHRRKSTRDLNNDKIATAMRGEGIEVGGDMVGKYFAGSSGVPIDNLGPFLRALGLKVVDIDCPDIDIKEYENVKKMAAKYLMGPEKE